MRIEAHPKKGIKGRRDRKVQVLVSHTEEDGYYGARLVNYSTGKDISHKYDIRIIEEDI